MFDWLGKKPLTADDVKAYQGGQDLGAEMGQAFNDYQRKRFGPVHNSYLNVLRERLQSALRSEEAPPLIIAKIESDLFVENLNELKMKMFDETMVAMSDWLDVAQKVGVRPDDEKTLADSIFDFCENLGMAAVKVVEEYQAVLRDADAGWRKRYPDRAAQFARKG